MNDQLIECSLFIDDFTNEKKVVVSKVTTRQRPWFALISSCACTTLNITLVATEQFIFLKFFNAGPTLKMAKGDEIIILFEDKSTLTYVFNSGGNKGCNVVRIGAKDLETLATKSVLKVRVTTRSEQEVFFIYGTNEKITCIRDGLGYNSEFEGQELLKEMAKVFVRTAARELPEVLAQTLTFNNKP